MVSEKQRVLVHYVSFADLERVGAGEVAEGFGYFHCFQAVFVFSGEELFAAKAGENHNAFFCCVLSCEVQTSISFLISMEEITIIL